MNNNDIMNNPKIKKMLSELKDKVHIPFELIVADAQGKLSHEGHSKVASHLNVCKECKEVFRLVKESISSEEADEQESTTSNIPISTTLQPKLKLVSTVNSKRDEIAEKMAELLLAKESWFAVKPAIVAYRNWLKKPSETHVAEREELAKAAFTGGAGDDREDFETIISSVKFSDYVCDLLAERCNSLDEAKQKLTGFVDDGMMLFDKIAVSETVKMDAVKAIQIIIHIE